jgi:hypothetical protein
MLTNKQHGGAAIKSAWSHSLWQTLENRTVGKSLEILLAPSTSPQHPKKKTNKIIENLKEMHEELKAGLVLQL